MGMYSCVHFWIVVVVVTGVAGQGEVRLTFNVTEELPPNQLVGNIPSPKGPYIILTDQNIPFRIDDITGDIHTTQPLDRETKSKYDIAATTLSDSVIISITINVLDINDNYPYFPNGSTSLSLSESFPNGSEVHIGSVIDKDIGNNGIKQSSVQIVSGNNDNLFMLETRQSGTYKLFMDLIINGQLDYESTKKYSLLIRVADGGNPPKSSDIVVNITVVDANDNAPTFIHTKYSTVIPENAQVGTSIIRVSATDLDSGENQRITYSLDRLRDPEEHFSIEPNTGIIRINKQVDYERQKHYELSVIARDNGSQTLDANAVVEVNITNVNEKPANINLVFLAQRNKTAEISENATVGEYIARISISDPDLPDKYYLNVNVTLQGHKGYFGLVTNDSTIYRIKLLKKLDRELYPNFNLTISAADSGTPGPPMYATKSFTLVIRDVNDNAPKFKQSQYTATVQEQAPAGSSVIRVTAEDPDEGINAKVTYSIKNSPATNSDWFQIDAVTGFITTRGDSSIDCEQNSSPWITIIATDGGVPALSSTATVNIVVNDVNDKEPVFDRSYYEAKIPENYQKGSCILTVSATDPDCNGNSLLTYRLTQFTDIFSIGSSSGQLCVVGNLDYESVQSYELTVYAADSGNLNGNALVKITLTDINDNNPVFYPRNYSTNIDLSEARPGKDIVNVQAQDADSGNNSNIQYSITSGNDQGYFGISSNTGRIYLVSSLPNQETVYKLDVMATDGGGLQSTLPASVYVSVTGKESHPPVFDSLTYIFRVPEDTVPGTTVGTIRASVKPVDGQSPDVRYSISSGDINGFFTINDKTGVISSSKSLDHDVYPFVLLNVKATTGSPPVFGSAQVNITILDVNDNSPQFAKSLMKISIWENENVMTTLYAAHATDIDSGENGTVRYQLLENPQDTFTINPVSGEVSLKRQVDYETVKEYRVVVNAYDLGKPVQRNSNLTLVFSLLNVNDNKPIFTKKKYVKNVSETTPIRTNILQVNATDLDGDHVTYSFQDTTYDDTFGIYGASGNIYLRQSLNREAREQYLLTVVAKDNGKPSHSETAEVEVIVVDANDNSPQFHQSTYIFHISENQLPRTLLGQVTATDKDSGNNAKLEFSFITPQTYFSINSQTGEIQTLDSLDRELQPQYDIAVQVTDLGQPPRTDTANVKVIVSDLNDNHPEFQNSQPIRVSVSENNPKGTSVVRIVAKDGDALENGTVSYSLVEDGDPEALSLFYIHPKSGWITTLEVLDFEQKSRYTLSVRASDDGKPSLTSMASLIIQVDDENDGRPIFASQNISFSVIENTKTGSIVGRVVAQDNDSGENGRVSYYLVGGNVFGLFSVNISTGDIYCIRNIDFEEASSHSLGIKAVDNSAYNPKSSTISVEMHVVDVNDNPPVFDRDPVVLSRKENIPVGSVLYTFTATDEDSGVNGTVRYTIQSQTPDKGLFSMNSETGELKVEKTLDYEEVKQVSLILQAEDLCLPLKCRLKTTITTWLFIVDVNDNAPKFKGNSSFSVLENEPVGFPVAHIMAVDADSNTNNSGNGVLTYQILSGNINEDFTIDRSSGLLTIQKGLDRELRSSYDLMIRVHDNGTPQREAQKQISVIVQDVNDNAPKFSQSSYQATIDENNSPQAVVLQISASDPDTGDNGHLTYYLPSGVTDDKFQLDSTTGQLRATVVLDREEQSVYTLTAYVKDSGYPVQYDMTTITVKVGDLNDNSPKFAKGEITLSIPENTEQPSIHQLVAEDADAGQNARLSYSIISGNIGNAFVLDSETGQLSCKSLDRETVPEYTLTIRASDPDHNAMSTLRVKVLDQNDNFPRFTRQEYSQVIKEDVQVGTFVLQVSASDKDEGENAKITYSLGNDTEGMFQVDSISGNITTNGHFDYEKKKSYTFYILAKDGGQKDIKNMTVPVRINILDVNDNAPIFRQMPYRKNLTINSPARTSVVIVKADDKDDNINGEVRYSLSNSGTDQQSRQYFKIDEVTGEITTSQILTEAGVHMLQIKATDMGSPALSSTGIVEVMIGGGSGTVSLRFQSSVYPASIQEHASKGSYLTTVRAEYVGSGTGPITYTLVNDKDQRVFTLGNTSGSLAVLDGSMLDYEVTHEMRVIVIASSANLFAYTTVVVTLTDVNDNVPKFAQNIYYSSSWEDEGINVYVTQVLATDEDSDRNGEINYSIISGNGGNAFQIYPPFSGIVVTNLPLDYEITPSYTLIVEAVDQGSPPLSSTCTLKIDVVDINDQRPNFPKPLPVNLSEASDVGSLVTLVTANDQDKNPTLLYNFSPQGNPDNTFAIDRFSGRVTLAKPLNHERQNQYTLGFVVNDTKHESSTDLRIYVMDENDNHPVFSQQSYQETIQELTGPGVPILTVNATDADSGANAAITYTLLVNPTGGFYIDPNTGTIFTNKTVEHLPDQQIITLVITAHDAGTPRLSGVVAVNLQIIPVNQHAPTFTLQTTAFEVPEDKEKGVDLFRITANDEDKNQEIYFSITSGNMKDVFGIGRKSGSVFLKENLDRESMSSYSLLIKAQDNGTPSISKSVDISIVVLDVNDQSPVFDHSEYYAELPENAQNAKSFLNVHASDSDNGTNAEIMYTVTSGNDQGLFIVNGKTGDVYITPNLSLDFENTELHKLIVRATDCRDCAPSARRFSAFATIIVNVTDVNEFSPVFPMPFYYGSVNENQNGTKIFQAHANDKDGGKYGKVTYKITNNNDFYIDSNSGWIYTNRKFNYEVRNQYRFDVLASDISGRQDTAPVVIEITDVDEFSPEFGQDKYSFSVPGNAKRGQVIGQVSASDSDGGLAGMVYYITKHSHDYFDVNMTTGSVFVTHAFSETVSRQKRESRHKRALTQNSVTLIIVATTGAVDSKSATTIVEIAIDTTCAGCAYAQQKSDSEDSVNTTVLAIVLVFIIIIIIIVVVVVIVVCRFKRKKQAPTVVYETEYPSQFDFPVANDDINPPAYDEKYRNEPITTPDISERSHHSQSSGRGSVEADDDEEVMMINSQSSFLNNSSGFRSKNMPDSGIQDDDNTSEPSIQNSKDYLARLGIEPSHAQIKTQNIMQSVESMHQFTEEGGGEDIGVDYINNDPSEGELVISDSNNDLGFHEPETQQQGSLSSVINSEEEYSGSYNWDYLLDWGPQYQPLAHVFTEIARLKDDRHQPKKQPIKTVPQRKTNSHLQPQVKMDPPPIITNAPPRAVQQTDNRNSQGSKHSSRTNSTMNVSLPSLPRSPISYESSFTSPAITPSYTPSLTPLATRSPSISPYGSGHNTPNRQRSNGMQRMAISSESDQELRI